jgi:hypothetical protein
MGNKGVCTGGEGRGVRQQGGRSAAKPNNDDDGNDAAVVVGATAARQRSLPKLSLQPLAEEAALFRDGRWQAREKRVEGEDGGGKEQDKPM